MRRFKVYDNYWRKRLMNAKETLYKPTDENGQVMFTGEQVYCIAKASGLKSKKKRHIIKRFRLVMGEAIEELVKNLK